jgi:hypothetical protein
MRLSVSSSCRLLPGLAHRQSEQAPSGMCAVTNCHAQAPHGGCPGVTSGAKPWAERCTLRTARSPLWATRYQDV